MKVRLILALTAVLAIAVAVAPSAFKTQRASAAVSGLSLHGLNKIQKRILSGFASFEAGIGVPTTAARVQVRAAPRLSASTSSSRRTTRP